MAFFTRKKKVEDVPSHLQGIRVKVSTRARRLALRVDIRTSEVVLTFPLGASQKKAVLFIENNRGWIERQRVKHQPEEGATLKNGSTLDVLGKAVTIEHRAGRGITHITENKLIVHGQLEHLGRRVTDFLKKEALRLLEEKAREKTKQLHVSFAGIRIRDPKSRWGSCGHDGRIMFSWRLVLCPPEVLDYVVAHEVAHRVHMNHSRAFWKLCASLTADAVGSKLWLKRNGTRVMRLFQT